MNTIKESIYLAVLLRGVEKFQRFTPEYSTCHDRIQQILPTAIKHALNSINQRTEIDNIIKKACRLSLGIITDPADESTESTCRRKIRAFSVLENIGKPSNEMNVSFQIPAIKMQLSEKTFAQKEFSSEPDYQKLWNEFYQEFQHLPSTNICAFSETLLQLLLKYTSCVPAAINDKTDITLYDHIKTSASLAICLYDYTQGKVSEKNPFLLVGADFSGIQPYIYQIVSKFAGKNLKGRSFYLRMLSDATVRYLLKTLDLFKANVIYNSGGGFYLLAPNIPETKVHLAAAIKHIEEEFFKVHSTNLFVAIDFVELSEDALLHQNGQYLGNIWNELFVKKDRKKSAKFASLIQENYKDFFEPILLGGEHSRDSITGEEFKSHEKIYQKDNLNLKFLTNIQIEIGKKLRETNLIVIKEGTPLDCWEEKVHITPANLGFTYYLLTENEVKKQSKILQQHQAEITILTLNGNNGDCSFLPNQETNNNIYNLSFYGGNETDTNSVYTFEDMCQDENFARMGVLRMDVDNLGKIFQKGIAPDHASLSLFTALSRSFDFFFSGYLNTIWRETSSKRSFIIYSGGDDIFIVGSWEVCIEIAEKIKEQFKKFTCYNPAFSLSGGIAIIEPKFPIMKGAEESEAEEKNAKSHIIEKENLKLEKNSISFMNMPLNWDFEYVAVKKLKNQILKLLLNGKITKSFISKILSHYANANLNNHSIRQVKTYWMLTYDLSRMKQRSAPETISLIDCCIREICNKNCGKLGGESILTNYHPLELWALACRWAELEYRTE